MNDLKYRTRNQARADNFRDNAGLEVSQKYAGWNEKLIRDMSNADSNEIVVAKIKPVNPMSLEPIYISSMTSLEIAEAIEANKTVIVTKIVGMDTGYIISTGVIVSYNEETTVGVEYATASADVIQEDGSVVGRIE